MAKEYKAGQFVSICGELHRVKKAKGFACSNCPNEMLYLGKRCDDCIEKLSGQQYPIKITK